MAPLVLGIDLGTSGVRVAVLDLQQLFLSRLSLL